MSEPLEHFWDALIIAKRESGLRYYRVTWRPDADAPTINQRKDALVRMERSVCFGRYNAVHNVDGDWPWWRTAWRHIKGFPSWWKSRRRMQRDWRRAEKIWAARTALGAHLNISPTCKGEAHSL